MQTSHKGHPRKLCGHLKNLNGFVTDKLAVQKLKCEVSYLVLENEHFSQAADAHGAAVNYLIVGEVAECDRLVAVANRRHELGDDYSLAHNGIVGMIPEVVAAIVL